MPQAVRRYDPRRITLYSATSGLGLMGQYLAIGIALRVVAADEEAKSPLEEAAVRQVVETLLPQLDVFEAQPPSEDGRHFEYRLSRKVFEDGLLPLLEAIYPRLRSPDDAAARTRVLEQLRATSRERWLDALVSKELASSCLWWERPFPDFLRAGVPFQRQVRLSFDMVGLFAEGKMLAECWRDSFSFFQLCIHQTFAGHELAKALRVYFSG